ncbi:hypothetical protein DXG01_015930 [Tephrocybe rancida]|nr:hypothetical protein DXG01_015930 [Tephrocybe rancida]
MTTLTSHALPILSPLHTGIAAELEPDKAWKDALQAKIEDGMATMVEDAKNSLQSELDKGPVSEERREALTQEYQRTMHILRALAQDTFAVELERERQERRWAAGVDMTPTWNDALVQEQQDIMNRIKGVQKDSQSPSTTEPLPIGQPTETRPTRRAPPLPIISPAMPDDSDMVAQGFAEERRETSLRALEHLLPEGSIAMPQPSPALHEPRVEQIQKREQEEHVRRVQGWKESVRRGWDREEEDRKREEEEERVRHQKDKREREQRGKWERLTREKAEARLEQTPNKQTPNGQPLNWTFASQAITSKSSSSSSSPKPRSNSMNSRFPTSVSLPSAPSIISNASSSSSLPKPRSGSMNSTILASTLSSHPPYAYDEAEWKRRQEELFQQQHERFLKEQLRLEGMRQRTDSHQLTKEQVASTLERHERQWSMLHLIGNNLHWESIPWPMFVPPKSLDDITLPAVSAYVLTSLLPEEHKAKSRKDRIKDLIRKWHPDRFETKYLPRVAEGDRDKVKEGMEAVLQSLNDMLMQETERAVHPRRMSRGTARENEVESPRDELETRLEGVLRREKLVAARELEIRRMEQASIGRAEAAKRLEDEALKMKQEATAREKEARRREEETGRREEEVNRREEEAKRKEGETKRKEEEAKRKEEEAKRKEEEAKRKEEEARRIEEEAIMKSDHLQQQEDGLKLRERAAKAKEAELELLIAKARQSITLLKLRSIFLDVTAKHYRRLLQCDGRDAQTILDTFQSLLDTDAAAPDRGQLIVAMRRLSAKTQLYPQRYLIDGPVELIHEHPVDAGKFADIYKANFQGNLTCLKVIRVHAAALVQHMAKVYAREAIIWGQLSHPNLLPFYGLHTFRSQIAFVAPWAEKGNLSNYLIQEPSANRVLLCADTAAGVEYLHTSGVVHGDLKALNILVDRFGRACLSDFGLSGVADPEIIKWTTQSSAASKGGTSRWQAPELHDPDIENIHNSKESDVFGWASTSYEIFTGNPPFFEINSETRVTLMILRGDVPTRPSLDDKSWTARGLTEKIWELLKNCWRTQPSERPDISAVKSRIDIEKPAEDPRPSGQWGSGLAMRFRNAQEASIRDKRPSLEDLDIILSRVMDECRAGDDGLE